MTAAYCFTQDIVTAEDFFNQVSEFYAEIIDYKAEIIITNGPNVMKGMLLYTNQNMMKILSLIPNKSLN